MSTVRLSHPACAITSAEKELGTCNHPFTAVSPPRQISLSRFSLILDPLSPRLGCPRFTSHAPIHPGSRRGSPPARLSVRRYRSLLRDFRHGPENTSAPAARARISARYGGIEQAKMPGLGGGWKRSASKQMHSCVKRRKGLLRYDSSIARVGRREHTLSTGEKDKALVRHFNEAQTRGDLHAMREVLTPDFDNHWLAPGQEEPGREGYIRSNFLVHTAFSDIRYLIEEQMAAEGDRVVSRLRISGTLDRGPFMGFAPDGKGREASAIVIHRIEGGKIAEEWREGSGLLELTRARLEKEIGARERVDHELRVARRIQRASLPEEVPELEGWQIAPYYQPAREVGGDFYDFHLLSEGRLGVVVGDATGKGVPAALVMSTTIGMLQLAARALDSPSPGEVLEQVNETLVARIPSNTFVTCFYAILEPEDGTLRYANAGHDPPYIHRSNDNADELRARGMPLGLMAGMAYEEGEASLREGESVLFNSDGLVEAHHPKGEMFGFPRLRALIAEHGEKEERSLGDFLMEELYSFVGEGWEQEDD